MTNRITDEMVEAGAAAIWQEDALQIKPWKHVSPVAQKVMRSLSRAALSAALPLMDGWQPIETAPVGACASPKSVVAEDDT
jgi:hypothetical protein